MKNKVKELLGSGKVALGAQLRFGSPAIAELFGYSGFDYIIPDAEHSPQTPVGIQSQLQAIEATGAAPIVRVPKNDPDVMRVYLDMGAKGILSPFVLNAAEAKIGADGLRYPPAGTRGWGPSRASRYGMNSNYLKEANDSMIYLPIIEDKEAVRNIDQILAVDGVDSFIIGPVDLSFSLGCPHDFTCTKFTDAINTITKAGLKSGKPMGTAIYGGDMFSPDTYKRFVDHGYKLLLIGGDEWMLNMCCKKVLDTVANIRG